MDLIILVVLLAGYFIIRSSGKIGHASYDAAIERNRLSESQFAASVYDDDVYWKIQDMLDGGTNAKSPEWKEAFEEIAAAYREMGWPLKNGTSWPDEQWFWFIGRCEPCKSDITRRILLANRGILSEWDAKQGIVFDPRKYCTKNGNETPFPKVPALSRRDWYVRQLRSDKQLGHYIVKKLREHGIQDEAFFVPNCYGVSWKSDKHSVYRFGSEPEDVPGRLVFYPVLSDYQRKDIA